MITATYHNMLNIVNKFFGGLGSKNLKTYDKIVIKVNDFETEISKLIGADKLFYQDLEDLISAVKDKNSPVKTFDSSCFDGNYVTGNVSEEYLIELDNLRNNVAKNKDNMDAHDDVMVY